jgi:hypothetical protein
MAIIKNRKVEGGKEFWDHVEKVAGAASPGESAPKNCRHGGIKSECGDCEDLGEFVEAGESSAERPTYEQIKAALKIAIDSYSPIDEEMGKLREKFDTGGEPEYPNDPVHDVAAGLQAHIAGTHISIEEALGGDPMGMRSDKTNAFLDSVGAAPAAPDKPLPTTEQD